MSSLIAESRRRILVVDDEPRSVLGVVQEFTTRGFEVDEARTQVDAMRLLRERKYDALLLDLMLPKAHVDDFVIDRPLAENGVEIFNRLLDGAFEPHGTLRGTFVFIITGLGPESQFLNLVRTLGAKAVFGKPVPPILVAETIRLSLEGK